MSPAFSLFDHSVAYHPAQIFGRVPRLPGAWLRWSGIWAGAKAARCMVRLEWELALLNVILGMHRLAHQKYAPPLNFTPGWLSKGMRRWNGSFLI